MSCVLSLTSANLQLFHLRFKLNLNKLNCKVEVIRPHDLNRWKPYPSHNVNIAYCTRIASVAMSSLPTNLWQCYINMRYPYGSIRQIFTQCFFSKQRLSLGGL